MPRKNVKPVANQAEQTALILKYLNEELDSRNEGLVVYTNSALRNAVKTRVIQAGYAGNNVYTFVPEFVAFVFSHISQIPNWELMPIGRTKISATNKRIYPNVVPLRKQEEVDKPYGTPPWIVADLLGYRRIIVDHDDQFLYMTWLSVEGSSQHVRDTKWGNGLSFFRDCFNIPPIDDEDLKCWHNGKQAYRFPLVYFARKGEGYGGVGPAIVLSWGGFYHLEVFFRSPNPVAQEIIDKRYGYRGGMSAKTVSN